MAKLPFSKLNIKANTNILTLGIGDIEVEVKEYLPIEEKLNLISRIVNQSVMIMDFIIQLKLKFMRHLRFCMLIQTLTLLTK